MSKPGCLRAMRVTDDSMFHRVYDCPSLPESADLDRTERIVEEAREMALLSYFFLVSRSSAERLIP